MRYCGDGVSIAAGVLAAAVIRKTPKTNPATNSACSKKGKVKVVACLYMNDRKISKRTLWCEVMGKIQEGSAILNLCSLLHLFTAPLFIFLSRVLP